MSGRIVLLEGDISEQRVDAIVNAANSDLRLGSGVAGAIRERGGPSIQLDCDAHGPIEVGTAAVTGAGDLAARFVIHAAGMPPGGQATEDSVRRSFDHSLTLASECGCQTVAVPAIGTGVGGLSMQRCAEVSIEVARAHLKAGEETGEAGAGTLREIRFVLFGEPAYRVFEMTHDADKVAAQMERLRRR